MASTGKPEARGDERMQFAALFLEIIEFIIEFLWNDPRSLSSCARTCTQLRVFSLFLLYDDVHITSRTQLPHLVKAITYHNISSALNKTRTLRVIDQHGTGDLWPWHALLFLASQCTNITALYLNGFDFSKQPCKPESITYSCQQLVHVTHLHLIDVRFRHGDAIQRLMHSLPALSHVFFREEGGPLPYAHDLPDYIPIYTASSPKMPLKRFHSKSGRLIVTQSELVQQLEEELSELVQELIEEQNAGSEGEGEWLSHLTNGEGSSKLLGARQDHSKRNPQYASLFSMTDLPRADTTNAINISQCICLMSLELRCASLSQAMLILRALPPLSRIRSLLLSYRSDRDMQTDELVQSPPNTLPYLGLLELRIEEYNENRALIASHLFHRLDHQQHVATRSVFSTLSEGQVDYLSHEWREEDVWRSWRSMTRQKDAIANGRRLENASWRTWWKQRNKLKTISPDTLNWFKDSDITWLYGPLHSSQPLPRRERRTSLDEQPSRHELSSHDLLKVQRVSSPQPERSIPPKKPILKRRSISQLLSLPSPVWFAQDGLDELTVHSPHAEESQHPKLLHTKGVSHIHWRGRLKDSPRRIIAEGGHGVFDSATTMSGNSISTDSDVDVSSSAVSGDTGGQGGRMKHIKFNTFVEQYIVIGPQYDDEYDGHDSSRRHGDMNSYLQDDGDEVLESQGDEDEMLNSEDDKDEVLNSEDDEVLDSQDDEVLDSQDDEDEVLEMCSNFASSTAPASIQRLVWPSLEFSRPPTPLSRHALAGARITIAPIAPTMLK